MTIKERIMETAAAQLEAFLQPGEKIEAVVFGHWEEFDNENGWSIPRNVPSDKIGKVLSFEEAKPFMLDWQFDERMGVADCHAIHVWTNQRTIWADCYDGAVTLQSAPLIPTEYLPVISGG